jgi:hypothetical protein
MRGFYDKGNALDGEEAEESPHDLQKVRKEELQHPREGLLSLRLREVRKNPQICLAVEDYPRRQKEIGDFCGKRKGVLILSDNLSRKLFQK